MVAEVASIEVTLKLLGIDRFQAGMRGQATVSEQTGARVAKSMDSISASTGRAARASEGFSKSDGAMRSVALSALRAETSVLALSRSFTLLGTAVGGIAGGVAVNAFKNYADAATTIANKLAVVIPIQSQRAAIDKEIFETAQRTRTQYESTASIFSRMSLSSKELGASQQDVLKVVETTQKALKAGGATSGEAASIATQLTQALGSGRGLAGDELKSIAENSPVLLQAIATEFGVTTGALKDMGAEGQLAADRVFKAILKAGTEVDRVFSQTTPTIADGIQQIDNALTRYIGNVDKSIGATKALTGGLSYIAKNLESIGDGAAVAVAGVAASLLGRGGAKAVGAVKGTFTGARDTANEAVVAAQALERQKFADRTNALGSALAARYRAQQVEAAPSTSLAGPKAIADLVSAEKKVQATRDALRQSTEKLAQAEQSRSAIAAETITASKASLLAEERAQKALENRRGALGESVNGYAEAGRGIGTQGTLPKRSAERLAEAVKEREELTRKLAEVDAKAAAAQGQLSTGPQKGALTQGRADRVAALNAEIAKETADRNRVGLELQNAIRSANEKEEALQSANNAARTKAANEVERIGARLVSAESSLVKAREDLATKSARTASGGSPRSAGTVIKAIEEEIQAQERVAKLTANRDALASTYLDKAARAPNVTGSLKGPDVKALSVARQARDALFRDLEEIDSQIKAKVAERDKADSGITPFGRKTVERNAASTARAGELNATIAAATAEREALTKRLEETQTRIAAGEEALAARTADARARGLQATIQAGARLREVQAAIGTDLANLNTKRAAVIASEVANEEDRARRLVAVDKAIAENRANAAGIKQAIGLNDTGVSKARQAVEQEANGQREAARASQAAADAAVVASRKASEEVAATVARAQKAATTTAVIGTVARTSVGALGGLVGLLGGPFAATLTAASVGLAGYAIIQARAADEVKKHSSAVEELEKRTKALTEAQGAAQIRSTRQTVEDANTAKNAVRAIQDGRNSLKDTAQSALRSAAPSAQRGAVADEFGGMDSARATTVLDDAARRAGTSMSLLISELDAYPKSSQESAQAARNLADTILEAAKADPRLAPKAIEADEYAKSLEKAASVTRKFNDATVAAANVKLPTPLDADVDFKIGDKFNGEAATAGAKAYLDELGDEITKINGMPIVLSGLEGSTQQLRDLVQEMAAARAQTLGLLSGASVPVPIGNAVEAFKTGKTSAAEYGATLQELKTKYPDFAPLIQSLIDANERLLKAQATAAGLGVDLNALDGRVVDILIKIGVSGQLPDIAALAAKEQAKADKAVADQEFGNKIARLRADNKDAEADTLVKQSTTPALDVNKFREGVIDGQRIARDMKNRMPDLKEEIDAQVKSGSAAVDKTVQETMLTRLEAQGKDREAALVRYQRDNPTVDPKLAERLVNEKADADDALAAYKKSQKPARGGGGKKSQEQKDEDTLAKKLQELDQDAKVSGLDSFDQKTVRFAQSAKVATDQIEAFIQAARSGDMSNVPPTMQAIYEKMMLLEGVKLAKTALDEIFPFRKLARELEELKAAANASPEIAANIGLIEMQIRANNAPDWAKGISSGITDAAKSVATGTATIGDAMQTLKTKIIGLALDAAFKPLETAFTSMLTQLGGGNTKGFDLLSLFGGSSSGAVGGATLYSSPIGPGMATGGLVGGSGQPTADDQLIAASSGEFMVRAAAVKKHLPLLRAINEDRLVQRAGGGMIGQAVGAMSMSSMAGANQDAHRAAAAGAGAEGGIKVVINEAPGGDKVGSVSQQQRPDGGIEVMADMMERRTASRIAKNRGALSDVLPSGRPLRGT